HRVRFTRQSAQGRLEFAERGARGSNDLDREFEDVVEVIELDRLSGELEVAEGRTRVEALIEKLHNFPRPTTIAIIIDQIRHLKLEIGESKWIKIRIQIEKSTFDADNNPTLRFIGKTIASEFREVMPNADEVVAFIFENLRDDPELDKDPV